MGRLIDIVGSRRFSAPRAQISADAASAPFVEYRDVSKSYDGRTLALSGLSCAVRHGEFLTFLGPSGSGKTTALMLLAGFEAPTSGEVYVRGAPVSRVPPYRRNMGVVFQNYALFPHMTVAENIAFPLKARRMSSASIAVRLDHVLRLVRLSGLEERRMSQLSGGQQQRVALARALVFSPDVILMDEPLGALDRQLRERLQFEIKEIQRQLELTVIYVTHDQAEALTMSDRIAVFCNGELQQIAAPQVLYDEPRNAFVAQFVGESNTLRGLISELHDGSCLVRTDGGRWIRALCVGEARPGARTTVSVRPERVAIGGENAEGDNVFTAEVEDILFLGDHMRVRMALAGDGHIVVSMANPSLGQGISAGQKVPVRWHVGDCRAFCGPANSFPARDAQDGDAP